jgi:hypothetical protein
VRNYFIINPVFLMCSEVSKSDITTKTIQMDDLWIIVTNN